MANVSPDESIARMLCFSKWFTESTKRVGAAAFVPHPHVALSVTCIEGVPENEIWESGRIAMSKRFGEPKLYGRADVKAQVVYGQELSIDRDDNPLYHANIKGWREDKAVQLAKAQEIARSALLRMMP
jgi:hypothetical protein